MSAAGLLGPNLVSFDAWCGPWYARQFCTVAIFLWINERAKTFWISRDRKHFVPQVIRKVMLPNLRRLRNSWKFLKCSALYCFVSLWCRSRVPTGQPLGLGWWRMAQSARISGFCGQRRRPFCRRHLRPRRLSTRRKKTRQVMLHLCAKAERWFKIF